MSDASEVTLHASCVALDRRAVLILGPSGAGKSGLALQLIAMGCQLVADDRTLLQVRDGQVWARVPDAIRGRIEARFVGILAAPPAGPRAVALAVDLGQDETERLPIHRTIDLCGQAIPCLRRVAAPHFPAAVLLCLGAGRIA